MLKNPTAFFTFVLLLMADAFQHLYFRYHHSFLQTLWFSQVHILAWCSLFTVFTNNVTPLGFHCGMVYAYTYTVYTLICCTYTLWCSGAYTWESNNVTWFVNTVNRLCHARIWSWDNHMVCWKPWWSRKHKRRDAFVRMAVGRSSIQLKSLMNQLTWSLSTSIEAISPYKLRFTCNICKDVVLTAQ